MNRLVLAAGLLLAACGGDADVTPTTTSTSPPATTAVAVTTSMVAEPPSTTLPATTTTSTTTTTLVPATPTLADGRPATFIAVTEDYEAVEVDTVTGEILHFYGQTGTPAEMAAAEEIDPNVIVAAWRTRDGSYVGLSDCCEPAAGRIYFVAAGETLADPYGSPSPAGWTLSPSPIDNRFANLGYSLDLFDPANLTLDAIAGVWIAEPPLGFPAGAAAWSRDGAGLFWIGGAGDERKMLLTWDLAAPAPSVVAQLDWVGPNQSVDGIGMQGAGRLVGFLHTYNDEFDIVETEGVVFSDADGELLAKFPVETNSLWGGYDQSGRFLIYVGEDNTVRWQGLGQSGSLGTGFIFASW